MMNEKDDRFGTQAGFEAAREAHGVDNPVFRMGMYVPTREEVATRSLTDLTTLLDLWMWESPTELIPSRAQIEQVRSILAARPDAHLPEAQALIATCDQYVKE